MSTLLALGAHPDDLEFGCGGLLVKEAERGQQVHCLLFSRGEAGTYGDAHTRTLEAEQAAKLIPAQLSWLELDGDARLQLNLENAMRLAAQLRAIRPDTVLGPTGGLDQHPDHLTLHQLTLRAVRLARYGKVALQEPPHRVRRTLFYRIGSPNEGNELHKIRVDISRFAERWQTLMECHQSQVRAQKYVEYQLARARTEGLEAGVEYAQCLYSYSPPLLDSLEPLS